MLDSWNILVIPFAARCRFPFVPPLRFFYFPRSVHCIPMDLELYMFSVINLIYGSCIAMKSFAFCLQYKGNINAS